MLNRTILIGRLVRQPELKVTPNGVSVCSFTLAVDRPPRDGREKEADFLDCISFGKTAENLSKYMDKGKQVAIEGRLQARTYETRDGQKRKAVEVVADSIQFLSPRTRDADSNESQFEE